MKEQKQKNSKDAGQWLRPLRAMVDVHAWEQGRRYLEQGALQLLQLGEQGNVTATVQDYGERIYHQQLLLPTFSTVQQEAWKQYFQEQPYELSQLLQHQLPPALSQVARSLHAPLDAPPLEYWKMACSCPNRQVPCRHLVVVLLGIEQQIEQDPWWLFRLRGMNLEDLMGDKIGEQQLGLEGFPSLQQQALPTVPLQDNRTTVYSSQALQQLDWSVIANNWKAYRRLLDQQTLFYEGDLKKLVQRYWRKAIHYHKKQQLDPADYATWHQQLQQTKEIALIINPNHQLINLFAIQDGQSQPLFVRDRALETLVGLLETVDLKELPLYPESFIALHQLYRFAIKLLYEQAYLPYLLRCPAGYLIQWQPAYTVNSTIQALVEQLTAGLPPDLLLLDGEALQYLPIQQQVLCFCHLVGSYNVQQSKLWIPEWASREQKVEYCFFSGEATPFDGGKEQSVPQQMQAWLQPFYLGQAQYAPVIKVIEVEAEEGEERHFYLRIYIENKGDKAASLLGLNQFLKQTTSKAQQLVVLKTLQQLAAYYPDLENILLQKETQSPLYTITEFEWIFFEVLPLLQMLHIAVILPYSLQQLTKPRLGLHLAAKAKPSAKKPSFVSLQSLLTVEWKVDIGTEMIEAVEFLKLMKKKQGLVRHKGRYLYLSEEELQQILEQLETPPPAAANQLVQMALSHYHTNYTVDLSPEVETLVQAFKASITVAPPQTLQASLRPYQAVGYAWMYKNAQLGLGSLIADDMGLGKTLQVIALLLKFKEENRLLHQKVLVVVPTSLLTNWQQEIRKFAPLLQVGVYHGPNRRLSSKADVVLTTYGVARMEQARLNQLDWYALVIDEAQAIKNVQAGQTTAIKSLKANLNIAMSGTPVENRLAEYWSIMDFVNPNYLGSMAEFEASYSHPIEQENNQQCLKAFRKATAPFILRRLKSDKSIIQDLPDKIEQNYTAQLQPIQAELYQKIVKDSLAELQLYKQAPKKRKGLLLKLMGSLKQICNHPYQYLQSGGSGPVYSGKSQLLLDLLTRIERQQEKVLVFTQYRKMGRLMKGWIKERFGKEPLYLHGGCTRAERDSMVQAFQQDKQERVFLLSLKAAGTGLNLTAANHVIHYDLWWNPAVEAQATDRAYRIGQQKNVQVYRFITQGTLEEKIDAMIQSKKALANQTVTLGEQWLGDLSPQELEELLQLQ
jgi:uncharacterized Zn finger protein/ERCC4-related helicase